MYIIRGLNRVLGYYKIRKDYIIIKIYILTR